MNHRLGEVDIRYTLDDNYPTVGSPLYAGPIRISETTRVRAAVFRKGKKLADRDVVVFKKVEDLGAARSH